MHQRCLLVGQQRDVGKRLGGAGEVICEQNARGRRGLAVFLGGVGVGHRMRLWTRFWVEVRTRMLYLILKRRGCGAWRGGGLGSLFAQQEGVGVWWGGGRGGVERAEENAE